jgi:hypothetical protein
VDYWAVVLPLLNSLKGSPIIPYHGKMKQVIAKLFFFFIFALLNVDRIDMDALTFIHQPSFSFLLFRAIERKL